MNGVPDRIVRECVFGIACYELELITDQQITYRHCGIVSDAEDAKLWLEGKSPESLVGVYPIAVAGEPK